MTDSDDSRGRSSGVLPSKQADEPFDVDTVNPEDVLDRLEDLDVHEWSSAGSGSGIHLGPAAEEFHEAFELGTDPETVAAGDADGVALAAIQGLSARLATQRERIERQDHRIDTQQELLAEQRDDLESLRETVESVVAGIAALRAKTLDDRER